MEGLSVSYHDDLAQVIDDVIAPNARQGDREGKFPRDGLDALGRAGILGLTVAAEHGGGGLGMAEAADAVQQVGRVCGSTSMVMMMHYSAVAVLNEHGPSSVLREVAAGRHLSTPAFSEAGSRSHFWVPMSSAREE